MNKYISIAFVLAVILCSWLGWYFSDKQVIKRQLIGFSWDLSKEEEESTMETALKMRGIKAGLAAKCLVLIPEGNHSKNLENEMIIRYLIYFRNRFERISVLFAEDMSITIPTKGEAVVQSTVLLHKQKMGQEPVNVSAPVELSLKKQEGEWLLNQAELAKVLVEDLD
ncbi:MAG: hypothetical protein D3923_05870 [Candidatus Electrothrix sp. AR3]|nr:hypothetical protein [Candidatus Electrothrix sp. AR3]